MTGMPHSTAEPHEPEIRSHNLAKARFLTRLAWSIEIVLVLTGIGIAAAQAASLGPSAHFATAFPIFGVFAILAMAELSKIPAAVVACHTRGWARVLPVFALLLVSAISAETIFNGFERFAHVTTAPVTAARLKMQDLIAGKRRLSEVALSAEGDISNVIGFDGQQREILAGAVLAAEQAHASAIAGRDSFETMELRKQLEALIASQSDAAGRAGADWDREQQSIERRLKPSSGIAGALRDQLLARMRAMPARQSVTDAASAGFAPRINDIQERIEKSIATPPPEVRARIAAAGAALAAARNALADFEVRASANQRDRVDLALESAASARARAAAIEDLEAEIAVAERQVAQAASASQMHRWASFFFEKSYLEVRDEEAKRVAAVMGSALAVAAALAGSMTAIFAEWFRVRGVRPVEIEVPVEVPFEVRVPFEVEVPVERVRLLHVPVPSGPHASKFVAEVLDSLPAEIAETLRDQLQPGPPGAGVYGEGGENAA